uniref:Uncharacterized protein n=1 Tax=Cacopsylla melanoneura TaxID=428564 RepID=A0A8D8M152_9HEMI
MHPVHDIYFFIAFFSLSFSFCCVCMCLPFLYSPFSSSLMSAHTHTHTDNTNIVSKFDNCPDDYVVYGCAASLKQKVVKQFYYYTISNGVLQSDKIFRVNTA